jgi:hypothetical protein
MSRDRISSIWFPITGGVGIRPGVGCVASKMSEGMPRVSGPTILVDFVFRRMAIQSWRTILRSLRSGVGYGGLAWMRLI